MDRTYTIRYWSRILGEWVAIDLPPFQNQVVAQQYARQEQGERWIQVVDDLGNVVHDIPSTC